MVIRPFRTEDAQRCCKIIKGCLQDMDGLNKTAKDYIYENCVPEVVTKDLMRSHTLVYERDNSILAIGALAGGEIKRFYTFQACQRQHFGSSIYASLEHIARCNGLKRLKLESVPSAVKFWDRCGFDILKSRHFEIGESNYHFIDMEKTLK